MISNALDFTVYYDRREDGGVRLHSPELLGLYLSFGPGADPAKVAETVESAASYLAMSRLDSGRPIFGL